ncbi:hypothetical protein [Shewanella woodyi]|uniref:hypothetical protein n=1 Tax=Shewanella woodyi TaxID=60961 RepID=UPI0007F93DCB|nr:hypothetical protein [Shewanella woodyi]
MSKFTLLKPLEWYMYGQGFILVGWLYVQIVLSPMAILSIASLIFIDIQGEDTSFTILYFASGIGFIAGLVWAERIRRTIGILTFHSFLLSTPEIEGWRDRDGKVISRQKPNKL